jgi:predicted PurR-regulated permease PerM
VVLLPILLGLLLPRCCGRGAGAAQAGRPDALAAIGVLLLALLLLFGVVGGLAPQVTGQAQELADQVSAGLEELEQA